MHAHTEAPDRGIPHDHIAHATVREPPQKSPQERYWESFGRNIAKQQKGMGLTNAQLAKRARISAKTLERIKAGSTIPTYPTLEGLTRALHFVFTIAGHKHPR